MITIANGGGHGPKGWLEKGPSASLFVRYVSQRICSSLTPRIQTLLKPTVCLLLMTRCTSVSPPATQKHGRLEEWKIGRLGNASRATVGPDLRVGRRQSSHRVVRRRGTGRPPGPYQGF